MMQPARGFVVAISRRSFLTLGAATLSAVASAAPARASEVVMQANARGKCATCQFWGGARSLSKDRRTVSASGTGLCSNPQSPAYQRQTRPDQGAKVWQRWDQLG